MAADRNPSRLDRYHGALLGLAAGDALGTTQEFKRKGSFAPIDDMVGGGPFGLNWLCVLCELGGESVDCVLPQMPRYSAALSVAATRPREWPACASAPRQCSACPAVT